MSAYREPGVPAKAPADQFDIIQEAWRLCKERQAMLIGKEPPRWRFIAHMLWEERRDKYAWMTPDKIDLMQASVALGARTKTMVELFDAHTQAHRGE